MNMQTSTCDSGDMQNKRMMSIRIDHFGPILRGTIDLRPLTLFVGPNGCGKSHAATLLYTISRLEQDYERARFYFGSGMPNYEQIKKEATLLLEKHKKDKNKIIRTELLNKLANPEIDLGRMLKNNFGVLNKDLIQKGQSCASVHVRTHRHDDIRIKITASKMDVCGMDPPSIKVLFDGQSKNGNGARNGDGHNTMAPIRVPHPGNLFEIYDALMRRVMPNPDEDYSVYYFPAERAGLMLAYNSLADNYISRAGRSRYNPSMPTVATDYLRFLNSLPNEQSVFAPVANDAEKAILRGEVTTRRSPHKTSIYFQKSRDRFPLRVTASSVKDLAAFFLYLKFVAEKNDLVVLEEPETNLHPKNQVELAKFIARLINLGLYVVLTTHSPYFLEQMSHCVMAGQVPVTGSDGALLAEECLSPDMVSVHKFESVKKYYQIKRVEITGDGIPQDEFLVVDDEMYQELSRLRQANEE